MNLLDEINSPSKLKKLKLDELYKLAEEIRNFLIYTVSKTGGHLASNLGVVELTIALHRVFNMPEDKIIWDVGHQSYVHKILTGRKNRFSTLRKYGGLSGFPKPSESPYDVFAAGHSSTSISAALGMAKARDIKNEKYNVVAVIGDGALTGGLALEGLNEAGISNTNIIVVLNDNEMSISKNVGSIAAYLSKIRTDPTYLNLKDDLELILKKIPTVGNNLYKGAEKLKESLKYLLVQGMLFEEMGFTYLGPIDGHDIQRISEVLERAKNKKGPVLIHVITKKGKGYCFAEESPEEFHGIGPFEIETGENIATVKTNYSKVFGEEIIKAAQRNRNIVAITAAMPDGTGLNEFKNKFPTRFFDVGIAEQHAVTFAAGLAANGLKPVFAVYSTFLQRAYDQIIHDVCLQNLPVVFAIDRAGIVGEDGETHQGIFDIAYLRSIPNITMLSPKDINEFRIMLRWCFEYDKPVAIRYPRGGDFDVTFPFNEDEVIIKGKWEILKDGNDIAVLAVGRMIQFAIKALNRLKINNNINAALINCRFIKPMDTILLESIFKKYNTIITIEDGVIAGGFGSAVLEYASEKNYKGKLIRLGFPDEFVTHGAPAILYKKYGLDADGIYEKILMNI
ncbi:1-deoxy-D-xylulose-5-phosphate synthase [Caloramator sp. E03]|nr:1-deoxy-D-xylulose-5-phosphate synthase [Caloramator sp. E03]QCX32689.1 1-deoxy-D-xylulose-5-phosphate synthase [Caloramator sp. E03]